MTSRQSVLKTFYPALMTIGKLFRSDEKVLQNKAGIQPAVSFYTLASTANDGQPVNFDLLKGKKVLIVNTASDCGYTGQYNELENLYTQYKNKLVIIGFPANDFKAQEKGSDEEIAQFCRLNYGITFPLMKKSAVIKSAEQNAVFQWLSDRNKNGWNDKAPPWNFSKSLIDRNSKLVNNIDTSAAP